MKRQPRTAQLLGHIIEPIAEFSPEQPTTNNAQTSEENRRYRLRELLKEESGKKTFLAIDEQTQTKVVVKIIFFYPDSVTDYPPQDSSSTDHSSDCSASIASIASTTDSLSQPAYSSAALNHIEMLPYLSSFEVDTPLGPGLAMVKPYTDVAAPAPEQRTVKRLEQPLTEGATHSRRKTDPGVAANQKLARQNFARTPKNVTPSPQRSFADITLHSTPSKLEIHCPESYIREGLISAHSANAFPDSIELWIAVIAGTVVFVGGSLVVTGSFLCAIAVAALLPILFHELTAPHPRARKKAIIRLNDAADSRTFVSVTTLILPKRSRTGIANGIPTESTLHCSRMSIKNIKIAPALVLAPGVHPLGAEIIFTFHNQTARTGNRLRLVGSYQSMRWLSQQLSAWGTARSQRRAK
ncbi:MAG: hypothetical protein AAFR18_00650 [Cyanobacteria bacterium J06627_32]